MDILEAIKEMKKGFRMCRESNLKGEYYIINDKTKLIEFINTRENYIQTSPLFKTTDILASDWKPYIKLIEVRKCTFGRAIEHIKKGGKAKREGWNGKEQYISLGEDIKCTDKSIDFFIFCKHNDIGSQAILFHGTRGVQIGWLASQSDMLSNDWILF